MATVKTCDKCSHYTPTDSPDLSSYVFAGSCSLMGDSNDQSPVVAADRAAGWDSESYRAGVYVGPKFGCIHWARKDVNTMQKRENP